MVIIEDARCDRETSAAIHVSAGNSLANEIDGWVPKSVIHDDSEVYGEGHVGSLVIPAWKADELKGDDAADPPTRPRPLPRQGEREAAVIQSVLSIIRNKAKVLAAVGAPSSFEAICECGECDEADPVGWHRREFAVDELNKLADMIEEATKP